jgi:hypothetical protein
MNLADTALCHDLRELRACSSPMRCASLLAASGILQILAASGRERARTRHRDYVAQGLRVHRHGRTCDTPPAPTPAAAGGPTADQGGAAGQHVCFALVMCG